jgi:hypothetical protein
MVQWIVFAGVWAGLFIGCFLLAGAFGEHARNRLNTLEQVDPKSTHLVHVENSTSLFLITILLAGILAVLISALLVK